MCLFLTFAYMNSRITKLYSCCLNNKVIIIETNFSDFYKLLKNIEPKCYSDKWYIRKFKEHYEFSQVIDDKPYFFQQLI